jgi:DNA-directed RNA polymerase subunit RPC12/RpoP
MRRLRVTIMPDDDVIKIPNENKRLGSCSNCGHAIFLSDCILSANNYHLGLYRCIECKTIMSYDELIPF